MSTPSNSPRVWKVSELVASIRACLEKSFPAVSVEGEIFSYKRNSSGHAYFSIKDADAQISAVMFRSVFAGIRDPAFLRDGSLVRAHGRITVYPGTGRMQLSVSSIEPAGEGALLLKLARLRKKLSDEGLFDPARKRPLPLLPLRIGVVTSPTGAVIRDIQNVLARHDTRVHLLLAPARVQGDGAADEIAAAIDLLNAVSPPLDLLVVARGGGSLEDLWCFNEEAVVRAVARSSIPLVSAVGHQTDFSLCDYAADVRAETPTAAAEMVAKAHEDLAARISDLARSIALSPSRRIADWRTRLASASAPFAQPARILEVPAQRLDAVSARILQSLSAFPASLRQRIDSAARRLASASAVRIERSRSALSSLPPRLLFAIRQSLPPARQRLQRLQAQLRLLNPRAVLARGYSLTRLPDGAILSSPDAAPPGTLILTELACGSISSVVQDHTQNKEPSHDHPSQISGTQIRRSTPASGNSGRGNGVRQNGARGNGKGVRGGSDPDQGLLF